MPWPPTIYVVDDDESVRKALTRVMRGAGLQCRTFASGNDFLREVPPTANGCVVLDISMPEMTGLELQAKLKSNGYQLAVIMLSVMDEPETRERARALGAVSFFRKPVDNHALLDAIQWAVGASPQTQ